MTEDHSFIRRVVKGFGQGCDFALGIDRQLLRQVAVRHGGHDFDETAYLLGEIRRHDVDVVGEALLGAARAGHNSLAAQPPVGTDLARHAGDFGGERA
jgi:hypothetical protein